MTLIFIKKRNLPDNPPLSFPFVIKNVQGKGGKEVFFIENNQDWKDVNDKLASDVIIQSTKVQLGKDLRVYVLGGKIVAAILRESNTSFKANYTLGGKARIYELLPSEKKIIHQITSLFDSDFIGIDFLINHEGELLFNEIEDVVGSRMLSELTDINILENYVTHIINKLE